MVHVSHLQWIEHGVFDAIEKQYLKSMSIIVALAPDDEQLEPSEYDASVIENYTFKV